MISTKTAIQPWGEPKAAPFTGAQVLEQLEKNLARLGTDYIDVYNLHGIVERQLGHVSAEIVPALIRAREHNPSTLASAKAVTEKVKKGEDTFYRARFAGLDSASAEQACRSLKRSGFSCFAAHD